MVLRKYTWCTDRHLPLIMDLGLDATNVDGEVRFLPGVLARTTEATADVVSVPEHVLLRQQGAIGIGE